MFMSDFDHIYRMDSLSYEPSQTENSINGIAQREKKEPLDVLMDALADEIPLLYLFGRYKDNLDEQIEAINNPLSVFGLSDGGAHCGMISDASIPTFLLTHWARVWI